MFVEAIRGIPPQITVEIHQQNVSFIKETARFVQGTAPQVKKVPLITRVIGPRSREYEVTNMAFALDRLQVSTPGRFPKTKQLISDIRVAIENGHKTSMQTGAYNALAVQLPDVAAELRFSYERSRQFVMRQSPILMNPPPNSASPMTENDMASLAHEVSERETNGVEPGRVVSMQMLFAQIDVLETALLRLAQINE
jgi:hypothetical protein